MTPEKLAAMEAEAARAEQDGEPLKVAPPAAGRLDEEQSPVAGRRFTRA